MNNRYLLNSAVITSEGVFEYRRIEVAAARAWVSAGAWISTIGYAETSEALGAILGTNIPVDRRTITMLPEDEALVFRLVIPAGERRTDPASKGSLSVEYILSHCEIGLLRRLS